MPLQRYLVKDALGAPSLIRSMSWLAISECLLPLTGSTAECGLEMRGSMLIHPNDKR